jgi:DNA-directed RNA polymerase subunit M/transcription elongation factor TFIIS
MKTILLVYLIIGIIAIFLGPLAKRIKDEFAVQNLESDAVPTTKKSYFSYFLVCFLAIFLYPLFYLVNAYHFFKEAVATHSVSPNMHVHQGIYFSSMNGSGRITCGDCGFTQRLVSLMYITKEGIDTTCRGYQCQSCGTFKEMSYEGTAAAQTKSAKKMVYTDVAETCGCGGVLEREKKLFCPKCQSQHLSYECIFKT